MVKRCLLYYITDRSQFEGDERDRRRALLQKISEAAHAGVDYIQLREKDLKTAELEDLAQEAVRVIRERQRSAARRPESATRLLINSRTDVALACGADGVHLRSDDIPVSNVRSIWKDAHISQRQSSKPVVAVSCHDSSEVLRAESQGSDFVVFAPVFEKKNNPATSPRGIDALQEACRAKIPVLALGGVTFRNAALCLAAGASGIAGIRLFQQNRIDGVVHSLRVLER